MSRALLSFISWDVKKEVFTVPLINRPVVWYGVFFAFGFLLGYLILKRVFFKEFQKNPKVYEGDIVDWRGFLTCVKQHHYMGLPLVRDFVTGLSHSLRKQVLNLNLELTPSKEFRKSLIDELNAFLYSYSSPSSVGEEYSEVKNQQVLSNFKVLRMHFPDVYLSLKERSKFVVEKISIYSMIGTLVGARLGHILFYEDLSYYLSNPLSIIKTWEGGLASHGGIFGVLIALFLCYRLYLKEFFGLKSFVFLLDRLCLPAALLAFLIRLGNFFNQEVLGVSTSLPWGIVFMNPMDGSSPIPRHPAQLYEGLVYLGLFVWLFYKPEKRLKTQGRTTGVFLMILFSARFLIEFVKEESSVYSFGILNMGQLLSIPIVLAALLLFFVSKKRAKQELGFD